MCNRPICNMTNEFSKSHALGLPPSRVKVIMKSSPDVESISPDALYTMTKATEMFVSHLSSTTFSAGEKSNITYKSLADVINSNDVFGFLQEVIPHKITVREYRKLLEGHPTASADA